MERQRVLAVRAEGFSPGSGYLINVRLALTSAHAVGPVGSRAQVFHPGEPPTFDAVVVWRGTPGGRDDAALMALDEQHETPVGAGEVRWGRTVTFQPGTAFRTWGVPDAVQTAGAAVEVAQPSGTLNPGEGLVADRYVLDIDGAVPANWDQGASPWGGLSGAAVFCGDLLTGVIVGAVEGWGSRRLTAVPAYALHASEGFAAALAGYGTEMALEPVEFQEIAEPAVVPDSGRTVPSPAGLLVARRAVVPFYGRENNLDQLQNWARTSGATRVQLIHGPGGQGKTRLARQLSARLAADGWVIVWLRADAAPSAVATLAHTARETLVILDYAESRPTQVATLLTALAARRKGTVIRVLLLARTAGWWQDSAADVAGARDLIETAQVTELGILDADEPARRDGYRAAVAAFAAELPTIAGQQDPEWPRVAASLETPRFPGPIAALNVHMTALADLLDAAHPEPIDPQNPAAAGVREVEDRVLAHEYGYWHSTAAAHGLTPRLSRASLHEAMAAAFLCGAATREQADALFAHVAGLADQTYDLRRAVRVWISSLYPAAVPSMPWDGLQPDRLAERFVGRYLLEEPTLADTLVPHTDTTQAEHLLAVYARAASHAVFNQALDPHLSSLISRWPDLLATAAIRTATRIARPAPLAKALWQISDDPAASPDQLARLATSLPRASHTLAHWSAHLTARLVAKLRSLAAERPDTFLPDLADNLNDLAVRLGHLGQREQDLNTIREAVGIRRRLAADRPDAFLPGLAASLNNLGVALGDVGQHKQALDAIHEAVEIRRRLAADRPDAFLPGLAASLNNFAIQLGGLGQRDQALDAVREAVKIRRELVADRPDEYLADLAMNVSNLAALLRELGKYKQALAASREAIEIRRLLAEDRPDAFLPGLAASLNNLAVLTGELGQGKQALDAVREAAEIWRRLAVDRPDVFLPDLAASLNNLAVELRNLGQRKQALAASREAVDIQRKLAADRPDVFIAGLAGSLSNLANELGELGEYEQALIAVREAVEIRRRLAADRPDVFLAGLASSLSTLAIQLGGIGWGEQALAAIHEAVKIYRKLAADRPDVFAADLAGSLNTLATELGDIGQHEQAVNTMQEAVESYRQLAADRPDAFLPRLAASLNNFAIWLEILGRGEQALAAIHEAVDIRRKLATANPTAHQTQLEQSLLVLALLTE